MITVSSLQDCGKNFVGTCNACSTQIDSGGRVPGSRVYVLDLQRTPNSGSGFNICPECAVELYTKLHERLQENGNEYRRSS